MRIAAFLAAKAVSDLGFALDFVCLHVFVWVHTASPLASGGLGAALYTGGILGGRLAQQRGDRWDRQHVMIGADLLRMAALVGLAAVPDAWQIYGAYPAMFAVGAGRALFEASLAAGIPALARGRVQLLNSTIAGLKGIAQVLGMGLAAIAVAKVGYRGVFLLDALTYGLSAAVLAAVPLRLREPSAQPIIGSARLPLHLRLAGTALLALVVVRGLDAFGSASHHVGLPILGSLLEPANPAAVTAIIWMTWSLGLLAGSFAVRPLVSAPLARAPGGAFYSATVVMSLGFIGVFWLDAWPAKIAAAGIAGVGDAISDVAFKQSVQQLPDALRGSAFGFAQVVVNAGFLAGLLATGLLLVPERLPEWVLALHGLPLVAALWGVGVARRRAMVSMHTR